MSPPGPPSPTPALPTTPPRALPLTARPAPDGAPHPARAGRPGRVNAIVVAYLGAALLAAVAGDRLPAPRWLALHLLVLGAASNAVVVWSAHFAGALLHARGDSRRGEPLRLALLNGGAVLAFLGLGAGLGGWLAALGGGLVAAAAVAHAVALLRLRRGSLGGPLAPTTWFYLAATGSLVVGASLGGALAAGAWPAGEDRLHAAHAHLNLLGWLALTVLGSLFMLWPAALRTRMADDSPRAARHTLALALTGLVAATTGLLLDNRAATAAGLLVYATGVVRSLGPFVTAARARPPRTAPAWMLAAATTWLTLAVTADATVVALRGTGASLDLLEHGLPAFVVGFVGQVLAGALTFLLPVVLGRGPEGNRRLGALLERQWRLRFACLNGGALLLALPTHGAVRAAGWVLVAAAAASFVLLGSAALLPPARRHHGWLAACLVVPLVAVLGAGQLLPAHDSARPTGHRTVEVSLTEYAVTPAVITVPRGTRLRLAVRNDGRTAHDLKLRAGTGTGRLGVGESAVLDAGVIERSTVAWCTIAAHHQAGMILTIDVGVASGHGSHPATATHGRAWNPSNDPPAGWAARDPALRPVEPGRVHHVTLHVQERAVAVAPGVTRRLWTFGGTVPGPVLHGRVGDEFVVRLVNDATMAHSIDFHASQVAPDLAMRPIEPGHSLVYRFRAEHAGIYLYHCGTAPLLQHVANGMYGALVVDPPSLARVDRELVMVQSELYLTGTLGQMRSAQPDLVVFNGYADQYRHQPVPADPGDRVRVWVLDAGPNGDSAFHVVGTQFDTVYKEGAYLLQRGDPGLGAAQALDLGPGEGGFVETTIPAVGHYPMVTHRLADAARGATGIIRAGHPAAGGAAH